jgi:glutamate/tyrosine decarboxylase-like PLP-dependent enzyme
MLFYLKICGMNTTLQADKNKIDEILTQIKNQGVAYINQLSERKTSTDDNFLPNGILPNEGVGTTQALANFNKRLEPLMIASSGPRYWGFVTGGSTPAAIAGDWLTSIYDQNAQTIKGYGDISANIEIETIQLLLDLFNLPTDFFGGFVTGATMSSFTCLAVARQWLGQQLGKDFAKQGVLQKINILTATPHSSVIKTLSLLGIGSNNYIKIKTLPGNREAVDVDDLENELKKLQGAPSIFIGSGGTVNTVDFDDFNAIIKLKETYNFWCHVDAAFGGFAICTNTHHHLLTGWQHADSITIDCHKWLNVPYESAVFFVKEKYKSLQIETFQNSNAPYLGNPLESFDYLNLLPENSRRLKALPVWFSLMAYGKNGIKDIVNNNIKNAQTFGKFIEENKHFILLAPVRLNTVCFSISASDEKVKIFLEKLNDTQKVFMTPTMYQNKKGIRAAFVNWLTTDEDVKLVTEIMNNIATEMSI